MSEYRVVVSVPIVCCYCRVSFFSPGAYMTHAGLCAPTLRAEDDPRRTVYGVPAPKVDE